MSIHAQAPDSWEIKWNGETILSANTEDNEKNTRKVSIVKSFKDPVLEIDYNDGSREGLKRSFLIFGKSDNELLRLDSTWSADITKETLMKALGGAKELQIYTIALPTDPEMAARVRVRRVHLCTLTLK